MGKKFKAGLATLALIIGVSTAIYSFYLIPEFVKPYLILFGYVCIAGVVIWVIYDIMCDFFDD